MEFLKGFVQKLGETWKDTYEKLQKVYGVDGTSLRQVYEWLKWLKMDGKVLKVPSKQEDLGQAKLKNIELVHVAVHKKL